MTGTFYGIQCESNRLDKSEYLGEAILSSSISIVEKSTIGKEEIKIRFPSENYEGVMNANYLKIETTGRTRYYFVKNRTQIAGTMFSADCILDVLMTFKDEILGMSGLVKRAGNIEDSYVINNREEFYCKDNTIIKKIGFPFDKMQEYHLSNEYYVSKWGKTSGQPEYRCEPLEVNSIILATI